MRILFVCLGNICRSPAAEAVFRAIAGEEFEIDSAGTGDWHVGKPPYPPMIRAARARGYTLDHLRARQIEQADFKRFDLIVCMDEDNRRDIERLRPAGNATPVLNLAEMIDDAAIDHIPDPYFTRDFEGALDLIEQAARTLADRLRAERAG